MSVPLAAHQRWGLVAVLYAYRAMVGLALAIAPSSVLGAYVAGYPEGDAVLFEPGGVVLVDVLRLAGRPLAGLGALAIPAFVVAIFFGLLPIAALLVGLGTREQLRASTLLRRSMAPMTTLGLLELLAAVAQGGLLALGALFGVGLGQALHLAPPTRDLVVVAAMVVALTAVACVRTVAALAQAAAVDEGAGMYQATARGVRAWRRSEALPLWAYAWRAALGLCTLAVAALLAPRLPLVASVALHQAAIAIAAYLDADWRAVSLRVVREGAAKP